MSIILGIDPGLSGAIAVLKNGEVVKIFDMPTMPKPAGKGNQINPYALREILFIYFTYPEKAIMEQVHTIPGDGRVGSFSFGKSVGIIEGACGVAQIPLSLVTPQAWKGSAGLIGKAKDAARALAIELHPEAAQWLTRKKDIGRADAICIAHFGEYLTRGQ